MPAVMTPRVTTEVDRNAGIQPLLTKRFDIDYRYVPGDDYTVEIPVEPNICLLTASLTVWEPWNSGGGTGGPPQAQIIVQGLQLGGANTNVNVRKFVQLNVTDPWTGGPAQLNLKRCGGATTGRLSVHFLYSRIP